jgi:selenocysteine lyase/cysteine desulfurase
LEYIEDIGGMKKIREHDQSLVQYALDKFHALEKSKKLELIGPYDPAKRVGVFSFVIPRQKNNTLVGETFAAKKVCIRCGGHCAYPLHKFLRKS